MLQKKASHHPRSRLWRDRRLERKEYGVLRAFTIPLFDPKCKRHQEKAAKSPFGLVFGRASLARGVFLGFNGFVPGPSPGLRFDFSAIAPSSSEGMEPNLYMAVSYVGNTQYRWVCGSDKWWWRRED